MSDSAKFSLDLLASQYIRDTRRAARETDKLVVSMQQLGAVKDPFASLRIPRGAAGAGAAAPKIRPLTAQQTAAPKIDPIRQQIGALRIDKAKLDLRGKEIDIARKLEDSVLRRTRAEERAAKSLAAQQAKAIRAQELSAAKALKIQQRQASQAAKAVQVSAPRAGGGGSGSGVGIGDLAGGGRLAAAGGAAGAAVGAAALAAAAAVATVGAAFGKASIEAAMFGQTSTRALARLTGGAASGQAAFDDARKTAEALGLDVRGTVADAIALGGAGFGRETSRQLQLMSADLDAVGGSGSAAVSILSEMADLGEISPRAIKGLNKAGIDAVDIYAELGRTFGKDRDELDKMIAAGKISTDQFTSAAIAASTKSTGAGALGGAAIEAARNDPDKRFAQIAAHAENSMMDVGKVLLPPIIRAMDVLQPKVTELIDSFSSSFQELATSPEAKAIGSMMVDGIGGAIDFVREVFPPLRSMAVDTMRTYGGLFVSLRDAWPTITKAASPFIETMKIVTSVGLATGRMVIRAAAMAVDAWAAVTDPVLSVFGAITSAAGRAIDWVSVQFGRVKSFVVDMWHSIPGPIRTALESGIIGRGVSAVSQLFGGGESKFAKEMQAGQTAADRTLDSVRAIGAVHAGFKADAANDNAASRSFGVESNAEWLRAIQDSRLETLQQHGMLARTGTDDLPVMPVVRPAGASAGELASVRPMDATRPTTNNNTLNAPITVNVSLSELGDGQTLAQIIKDHIRDQLGKVGTGGV